MKPMSKDPKILYFIASTVPTQRERLDARNYGPKTTFRNAKYVNENSQLEDCDGVTGCVPTVYRKKFPNADEVCAKYRAEFEELQREAEKELNALEEVEKMDTEDDEVVTGDEEKPLKKSKVKKVDKSQKRDDDDNKGAFGGGWGNKKGEE